MKLIFLLKDLAIPALLVFLVAGNPIYEQEIPDSVLTAENQLLSWDSVINQEWVLLYFYRGNW